MSMASLSLLGLVVAEIFTGDGIGNAFWGLVGSAMIIVSSFMILNAAVEEELEEIDFKQEKLLVN